MVLVSHLLVRLVDLVEFSLDGFQHLLFLVERREQGKPRYRLACDDLYKPSAAGGSPTMKSRDCYLDRGADGKIDEELHQTGRQAGKLEDGAFPQFIRGSDPAEKLKFAAASESAQDAYQSILRRMMN